MFKKKLIVTENVINKVELKNIVHRINSYNPEDIKVVEVAAYSASEFADIVEALSRKINNDKVVYVNRPINPETGEVSTGSVKFNGQ